MYYFCQLEYVSPIYKAENRVYICSLPSGELQTLGIITVTYIKNSRTFPQVTEFTKMICKTADETGHLVLIGTVFPFHLLTIIARLCFLCHSFPLFSLIPQMQVFSLTILFMKENHAYLACINLYLVS